MIVSVAEAKDRAAELIRAVEAGEKIVITRHGRPVAELAPAPLVRRGVRLGAMKDRIRLRPRWDAAIRPSALKREIRNIIEKGPIVLSTVT